jgi:hypothetical protein
MPRLYVDKQALSIIGQKKEVEIGVEDGSFFLKAALPVDN